MTQGKHTVCEPCGGGSKNTEAKVFECQGERLAIVPSDLGLLLGNGQLS